MTGVTPRRATMYRRAVQALVAFFIGVVLACVVVTGDVLEAARPARILIAAGIMGITALVMDRSLRSHGLRPVPVLTYHSVAPHPLRERWDRIGWGNLTVTPELFDQHLGWLARRGYRTVGLDDLHGHVSGRTPPLRKAVVITFDDGYLDNWVFAAPLLAKHGFHATVFVSSDFVEGSRSPRPSLDDATTGTLAERELAHGGYMSWAELRELERRGTFRVEAHGTTHAWCFAGEDIVDFYHHPDQYIWMFWNADPARKLRWQEVERGPAVGFGRPVYAYHRSQVRRRYFAPADLDQHLVDHVTTGGGTAFFQRPDWREELRREAARFRERRPVPPARFESDAEYWARMRADFGGNARDIERELGHAPRFLAWPGNAFTAGLRRLALDELGFLATTESGGLNLPGDDPGWIGRVHIESHFEGTTFAWVDRLDFIARVGVFAGNGWYLGLTAPVAVFRRLLKRRAAGGMFAQEVPEGFRVKEAAP